MLNNSIKRLSKRVVLFFIMLKPTAPGWIYTIKKQRGTTTTNRFCGSRSPVRQSKSKAHAYRMSVNSKLPCLTIIFDFSETG